MDQEFLPLVEVPSIHSIFSPTMSDNRFPHLVWHVVCGVALPDVPDVVKGYWAHVIQMKRRKNIEMNPAIKPIRIFTGDIAKAVVTNTRMVRAAISRELASATKVSGQGVFVLAFPESNINKLTINLDKCLCMKYICPL